MNWIQTVGLVALGSVIGYGGCFHIPHGDSTREKTMKTYTKEELKEIIREHHKWLLNSSEGKRADLRYADLRYANLSYADLRYANLRYVDLSSADLSYANLRYADLSSADLSSADLRYANLSSAVGNMQEIKSLQAETYRITYTETVMAIGCEQHSIEDWKNFDDRRILEMEGKKALEWWKKWKPILESIGVFGGER